MRTSTAVPSLEKIAKQFGRSPPFFSRQPTLSQTDYYGAALRNEALFFSCKAQLDDLDYMSTYVQGVAGGTILSIVAIEQLPIVSFLWPFTAGALTLCSIPIARDTLTRGISLGKEGIYTRRDMRTTLQASAEQLIVYAIKAKEELGPLPALEAYLQFLQGIPSQPKS